MMNLLFQRTNDSPSKSDDDDLSYSDARSSTSSEDHPDKEPDPKNDGDNNNSVPTPSAPKPGLDQSMLDALKPTPEEGNNTPIKRIQNFFKGLTEGKSPFTLPKPPLTRDDDDTLPAKDDVIDDVLKAFDDRLLNITDIPQVPSDDSNPIDNDITSMDLSTVQKRLDALCESDMPENDLRDQLIKIQRDVRIYQQKHKVIEESLSKTIIDNAVLTSKNTKLTNVAKDLRKNLEKYTDEQNRLQARTTANLRELQKKYDALNKDHYKVTEDLRRTSNLKSAYETQIEEQTRQLARLDKDIRELKDKYRDKVRHQVHEDVVIKLQDKYDKLSASHNKALKGWSDLEVDHDELQARKADLEKHADEVNSENIRLQKELDDCNDKLKSDTDCNCKDAKVVCCCCCCDSKKKKKKKKKKSKDPNDPNDPDDDPDDSGGEDGDDDTASSSDDDDDDEQLAYDENDEYVPETPLSAKESKAQSKDTAYTVKCLNRYAYEKKDFGTFDTYGNASKVRKAFHTFMEGLKEILEPVYGLNDLLADYPDLNLRTITHTKDKALGTFVKNKLSQFTKVALEGSIDHFRSGTQIIIYLKKQFGTRNALDVKTARDDLNTRGMTSGETIQNFGFRYLKLIQTYKQCAKASGIAYNTISHNEYIDVFLTHLLRGIDQTHALYTNVLTEHREHQVRIREGKDASEDKVDVMSIVIKLSAEEELIKGSDNKVVRTANNTTSNSAENQKFISNKFKPNKCLNCGHTGHKIQDCPKPISSENKKAIMDHTRSAFKQEHKKKKNYAAAAKSNNNNDKRSSYTRSDQKDAKGTKSYGKPKAEANTVVMKGSGKALPGTGFAGNVTVVYCHMAHNRKSPTEETNHVIVPKRDRRDYTNISSWLIDSGCSQHMTPVRDDLLNWEECDALVSMANGALVQVRHCGNVKICLNDIHDPNNTKFVIIEKVLYVPGLNRRLLSVVQWNDAGGEILFLRDHCRVVLHDDQNDDVHTVDVDSPFAIDMPFTANADVVEQGEAPTEEQPVITNPEENDARRLIDTTLLHDRLGHRSVSTLHLASEDKVWDDVRIGKDPDDFCETCKLTSARTARKGKSKIHEEIDDVKPGQVVHVDILHNPATRCIIPSLYTPYLLGIVCLTSRKMVPMPLDSKEVKSIFKALQAWATQFGPHATFNLHNIKHLHGDHDTAFTSKSFLDMCNAAGIKVTFAAPRHQEQNGIFERTWQSIRYIAMSDLNHARMGMEFFYFALENAWKVFSVLPHKALTTADGRVRCPLSVFYENQPVKVGRFRVMFCPVLAKIGPRTLTDRKKNSESSPSEQSSSDKSTEQSPTGSDPNQAQSKTLRRGNEPQQAKRGIYVGLPRHSSGWLVYFPSDNRVDVSQDVYFDERFLSPLCHTKGRFRGAYDIQVATVPEIEDDASRYQAHTTGSAFPFCIYHDEEDNELKQVFALPSVQEIYKDNPEQPANTLGSTLTVDDPESRWYIPDHDPTAWIAAHKVRKAHGVKKVEFTIHGRDNDVLTIMTESTILRKLPKLLFTYMLQDGRYKEWPWLVEMLEGRDYKFPQESSTVEEEEAVSKLLAELDKENETTENQQVEPSRKNRKAKSRPNTRLQRELRRLANACKVYHNDDYPEYEQLRPELEYQHELETEMLWAYDTEVVKPVRDVIKDVHPEEFLPCPDSWKQSLKTPPHIRKHWIESLRRELTEIINKGTFAHEEMGPGDTVTPVTVKYRIKILANGMLDKLKARIAFRGDLLKANVHVESTWCPVAGFRALRIFLAMAVEYKARIYQLDYVAAFLQAKAIGRKFTKLPAEWKEIFPDFAEWFGKPLLLKKSLYGDTVANLAWDETQNEYLTSAEMGLRRLDSEGSIYIKKDGEDTLIVLNAVDDQLYFCTSDKLRKWFEEATQKRFDVQLLGQAHWYLQSRIIQHADYSITLDQSRYAKSIGAKYLKPIDHDQITPAMKKRYAAPLPTDVEFTNQDCSQHYMAVRKLEEEYGFEYAGAVGSLIYLINTMTRIQFAVRKLARFMALPGEKHFKMLRHLLYHVQYHSHSGGIKYYADPSESPLHRKLKEMDLDWVTEYPIINVSDSSFQDCPDSSKSTGGYIIMMRGGVVDAASQMPSIITHSTGEAEYCQGALALLAASHVRKVYNELNGRDADTPLTIPIGVDSKAAEDIAASEKDTKRTRHIQRRYHYWRECNSNGTSKTFRLPGDFNWANSMTKSLNGPMLQKEADIFQVEVPP